MSWTSASCSMAAMTRAAWRIFFLILFRFTMSLYFSSFRCVVPFECQDRCHLSGFLKQDISDTCSFICWTSRGLDIGGGIYPLGYTSKQEQSHMNPSLGSVESFHSFYHKFCYSQIENDVNLSGWNQHILLTSWWFRATFSCCSNVNVIVMWYFLTWCSVLCTCYFVTIIGCLFSFLPMCYISAFLERQ